MCQWLSFSECRWLMDFFFWTGHLMFDFGDWHWHYFLTIGAKRSRQKSKLLASLTTSAKIASLFHFLCSTFGRILFILLDFVKKNIKFLCCHCWNVLNSGQKKTHASVQTTLNELKTFFSAHLEEEVLDKNKFLENHKNE